MEGQAQSQASDGGVDGVHQSVKDPCVCGVLHDFGG